MRLNESYPGLDRFRIVAALLVVANHTSPLTSYSETANFILTHLRITVPFFLLVTGFFLLAPLAEEPGHSLAAIKRYLRKTGLLYLLAVVLYLPVNLYAGQITAATTAGEYLRLIFVDGTFYHLWYLPAALTGVILVALLLRRLPLPAVLAICGGLYLIGLGGDSYYGLVSQWPAAERFYQAVFSVSSHTRNGLFYAPLYLALGAALRLRQQQLQPLACWLGTALAGGLLIAEALFLAARGYPRHDSMYLLQLPLLFFLFQGLLTLPGRPDRRLRDFSTWVYLLHPLWIVVVRGAAKFLGWEPLLIENSLGHFAAVAVASFASAALIAFVLARRREAAIRVRRGNAYARSTN